MKHLKLYGLIVLLMAMTLAACGGDDGDSPENTGPVEPNLTQVLTGKQEDVGSITLHYQEGWTGEVKDSGNIVVADSQDALDKLGAVDAAAPDPGEVYVSAFVIAASLYERFELAPTATPLEAVTNFMTRTANTEGIDLDFGEAESFDTDGRPAAIASGTVQEAEKDPYGVIYTMVAVDEGIGFITFATHADEVANYLDLARAMAGQFEFTPEGSF
jgi:hypothetical protein